MDIFKYKKLGIFAGGALFGTAGLKLLGSSDAKKVYTHCTAAVLRAKDCVMKVVTTIQENAEDVIAAAKQINEERAAKEAAKMNAEMGEEACCGACGEPGEAPAPEEAAAKASPA